MIKRKRNSRKPKNAKLHLCIQMTLPRNACSRGLYSSSRANGGNAEGERTYIWGLRFGSQVHKARVTKKEGGGTPPPEKGRPSSSKPYRKQY